MGTFEIISWLDAPADIVWDEALTPKGINYELRPWLSMTIPNALREANIEDVPLNLPLGRSWILLFGILPVELDYINLEDRGSRRFVEASTMLSQRVWRHEREVSSDKEGCWVRDRLNWSPRLPGFGLIAAVIIPRLFRHRHRRLIERYGGDNDKVRL